MITPGKIWHGTTVQPTAKFRNDDQILVDPASITARVFKPDGTQRAYVYGTNSELARVSTGFYRLTITPDQPGRWFVRWETTGGTIAEQDDFNVQDSPFYRGIVVGYQ